MVRNGNFQTHRCTFKPDSLKTFTIAVKVIATLLSGFMGLLNLSEVYIVGVLGNIEGYPFGREGPVPYYYKTPELYTTVMTLFGTGFLTLGILSLRSVKNPKTNGLLFLVLCGGLIAIQIVHGTIGV